MQSAKTKKLIKFTYLFSTILLLAASIGYEIGKWDLPSKLINIVFMLLAVAIFMDFISNFYNNEK